MLHEPYDSITTTYHVARHAHHYTTSVYTRFDSTTASLSTTIQHEQVGLFSKRRQLPNTLMKRMGGYKNSSDRVRRLPRRVGWARPGGALAVAAMAQRGKKRRGRKLEVGGLLTLAGR
jgi:hypothetical protein